MAKAAKPQKHVPQRTCVGCRTVQAKRTLIRLVRTDTDGVQVDLDGKRAGRGAYLHDDPSCWQKALKGSLAKALRTELSLANREQLSQFAGSLKNKPD